MVDDEPEVLRSIHDLLRIEYQVITCQSGPEAIEYLRAAPDVAVILSDQRMPGMPGGRAPPPGAVHTAGDNATPVHRLRRHPRGYRRDQPGQVFRYINKPWEPEELESIIRQAVERRDLIVEKARLLAELQAANAKLVETDRLKGAFLEVASHELNTPVTVVLGLTEMWKQSLGSQATPVERDWVERISSAAHRLARTVQRMLKLIENKEFGKTLNLASVDLEALVRQAVGDLTPYFQARRQQRRDPSRPGARASRGGPFQAHGRHDQPPR